jgi:hypothetical protein
MYWMDPHGSAKVDEVSGGGPVNQCTLTRGVERGVDPSVEAPCQFAIGGAAEATASD